jgi:nucleoside-diphosphate-sugar epimerase
MLELSFNPAISVGDLILITGVNGYIGAQVADKLLSLGYCVRGSVRNPEKSKPLQEHFGKKYGAGKFELVKVEKINEEGAFDEAAKGTLYASNIILALTPKF